MVQVIKAVFAHGAFIPQSRCDFPEGTRVELTINAGVLSPEVADMTERARILRDIVTRMNNNPIPANAPRFSRDEMHERR